MLTNKHLLLHPSGKMEWVELHRVRRYDDIYLGDYAYDLHGIYRALGVDFFEQVSLVLPGIVILIDDIGKLRNPPQPHNELASRLYGGYQFGDDIVGPALFFKQIGPNIYPFHLAGRMKQQMFIS